MQKELIDALQTLVVSVGFPIVAWGCQFWQATKILTSVTEAMNNVTVSLTKLSEEISDITGRG